MKSGTALFKTQTIYCLHKWFLIILGTLWSFYDYALSGREAFPARSATEYTAGL